MPVTRGARHKRSKEPTRKCIALGTTAPREELIRFVLDPDGVVTPDLAEKLPGRGIWVSAQKDALQLAIDKNLFSRGAKAPAKIPEGLLDLTEHLLVKRIIELISLARRGGEALSGFEVVKGALISERARLLLQANDGSERQLGKLRSPEGKNTYFNCLNQVELGLAFGRENVIHGALKAGALTKRIVVEGKRLTGFRSNQGGRPAREGKDDA